MLMLVYMHREKIDAKKTTCVLRNAEHFRTCIYCIMFLYTVDLAIKNPFPDIVMQSQFSVEQKVSNSYNLCKALILGFIATFFSNMVFPVMENPITWFGVAAYHRRVTMSVVHLNECYLFFSCIFTSQVLIFFFFFFFFKDRQYGP